MIDSELAARMVARHGSPVYVYDLNEVDRRVDDLRAALPAGATVLYAVKANPLPAIVESVVARGAGVEVSSPGEVAVALGAGARLEHALYTGPGKTEEEIGFALDHGIEVFSCESPADADRIRRIAGERHRALRLFFRLNPPMAAHAGLSMTGVASQFGFEEADLLGTLRRLLAEGMLDAYGLHVYYGTQVRSPEALEQTVRQVLAAAVRLRESLGLAPATIDFGGGFPWPYGADDSAPDPGAMQAAVAAAFAGSDVTGPRWFESGRFIAASAGTLLATVRDVKHSRGRRFVILDAGINHFGGMAGLGRIHLPRLTVTVPGRAAEGSDGPVTLVGPLCTPLDVIARDQPLPEVAPGDIVRIPNVGAYAATASLTPFLSRPAAAEVAVRGRTEIAAFRLRTGHERVAAAARGGAA